MPSHALDFITIRGFKSIRAIEKLKLNPINIVIGANGSGKSNFLGSFAFLNAVGEARVDKYVIESGGAEKVLHFGSKLTKELYFDLSHNDSLNRQFKFWPTPNDLLGYHWGAHEILRPFALAQWTVYHLPDTSAMRKTAAKDDNRFLRADASNLPAFLYYLRQKQETAYDSIRQTVQRVAPFFDDFRLDPLLLNPDTIKLEWSHKDSDQYFAASQLSDGTLRFIALATLFLQPEEHRPSLILVDEPELGLHPHAITLLASLIKQASVTTQVIVSTQSSLLLDHFEPEDVLVADRVSGGTQLRRLESGPLAAWLEDYSLGQLWEKNEIGGQPEPE